MIRCLNINFSHPKLSFLCSDWHYHWLQWLVMILMNIEYNVWLGHDSTTLCDSTRLDTRPLWLVTWLDSSTDLSDSWLDSGSTLMTRDSTRDSSQVTRQQLCWAGWLSPSYFHTFKQIGDADLFHCFISNDDPILCQLLPAVKTYSHNLGKPKGAHYFEIPRWDDSLMRNNFIIRL